MSVSETQGPAQACDGAADSPRAPPLPLCDPGARPRLFEPCFSRGAGGWRSPLADLIGGLLAKAPLLEDVVEGVDSTQLQALLLVVHRGRVLGHAALGSCSGDGEGAQGTRSGGPPCQQTLGAPPLGWGAQAGLKEALTLLREGLLTTGDLHSPFLRKRLLFLLI